MEATATGTRAPTFLEEVMAAAPGPYPRLDACVQCGTCSGSCPSSADMDYTPRALFAMIAAGLKKEVLQSNTPWYCVSCYYCQVRCPQEIRIPEYMYALKRMSVREGYNKKSRTPEAADFSETFVELVENYGRSFELGLATLFHLRHHPLNAVKLASLGLTMLRKGRMDVMPNRIKNIDQLRAILARAKEVGGGQ
jgi:heterodisulfide reductase subunit C